ncbi:MAG: hypothetical protein LBN21_09725 [Treponema sp.]|jgi:tetratricopeptide (TPR) repeat protein|nr:hypothetical protein [Treponema sp.]
MKLSAIPRLKTMVIPGLAIFLVLLGGLVFLTRHTVRNDPARQGIFFRELQEFDALLLKTPEPAPRHIDGLLNRLEKKAISVESRLSLLKRRRNLAHVSTVNRAQFQGAYRKAAERAVSAFPFSEPLAAIAADALLLEYPGQFPAEIQTTLRQYAGLFSEKRLLPLALDIGVLLGDLSDPAHAAALPLSGKLLAAGVSGLSGAEREDFLINAILYSLLLGDTVTANSRIVSLLGSPGLTERTESSQALRFGAEYFYDTNPLRAAELFSRFSDAPSLGRLADSLWLSGFREGAVEIWTALVSPGDTPQDLRVRSLYNLASVSADEQARIAYYGELFSEAPGHVYGVIGYSRLFDPARAEGILTEAGAGGSETGRALLELELLRRRLEAWELGRTVAETWLLLGRHPKEEGLYRWAAWYFDRQRRFTETNLLLRQARINGIDNSALVFHDVFRLIREEKPGEAEALLKKADPAVWQVPANLGLIAESRRSLSEALEYYERAYPLVKDRPSDAAKVQLKMAHCLRMLGRTEESRKALETVLELDTGNLTARMELRRLGYF